MRAVGSVSDEKREKRDTCLEHNVMYSAIKKEGEGGKREGEGEGGEREGEGGVKEGEQEVGGVRSYVNEGESEMGESEADEGLDQSLEEDMCQLWDASMNKVSINSSYCVYEALLVSCGVLQMGCHSTTIDASMYIHPQCVVIILTTFSIRM